MVKHIAGKFLRMALYIVLAGTQISLVSFPSHSAQAAKFTSSGGFTVSPESISIDVAQETTATAYLTISRVTDGSPGGCDGAFEIARNQPTLQKLSEHNDHYSHTYRIGSITLEMINVEYLGEEQRLYNGDTGVTQFTAANEVHFNSVVTVLTNGVNDGIGIGYETYNLQGDHSGGGVSVTSESYLFHMNPDFAGYTIQYIQRDVKTLSISSAGYSYDVNWSIWGYPPEATWVQLDPTSGTLEVGSDQLIAVTLDASGYEPGEYQTTLEFDPGSSCGEPILIPVTMHVFVPCNPVIDASLSRVSTGYVYPGDSVSFRAALLPTNPTPPFLYNIDGGPDISAASLPITFNKTFSSSGANMVNFSVRNCTMTPEQAVQAELSVWLGYRVFLPAIIK
jgi:hypothetical protein